MCNAAFNFTYSFALHVYAHVCRSFLSKKERLGVDATSTSDNGRRSLFTSSLSHLNTCHGDNFQINSRTTPVKPPASAMRLTRAAQRGAREAREKSDHHSFRILDLPPELVHEICEQLSDGDLINVRRTCRALSAHSFTAFGTRFFGHLITILHPTSLTILLELARHPKLSKCVRKVTVSGERIGHSILPMHTNMQPHFALQASIEKSGMDILILSESLRALKHVTEIQVDNCSYHADDEAEYCEGGIKCGRKHLYRETVPSFMLGGGSDMCYSRVYEVVLQALENAGAYAQIDLSFMFCILRSEEGPVTLFDLQSAPWVENASSKLRRLHCLGFVDPAWSGNLVQSTTDIRELVLQGGHETTGLSKLSGETLHWPALCRLQLDEKLLIHDEFTAFLRNHQDTLESLHLQSIGFFNGTWVEPLGIMQNMPILRNLFLNLLLERLPYNDASNKFSRFSTESCTSLELGRANIPDTLEALVSEIRTTPYDFGVRGKNPEDKFYDIVDLRKAEAADFGLIICFDGVWGLVESDDEGESRDEEGSSHISADSSCEQ